MANESRDYIIDRLLNATGSAEGSILPGRQFGEVRVPSVSSLSLSRFTIDSNGTVLQLQWTDVEDAPNVQQYNLYLKDERGRTIGPYSFRKSPGEIQVPLENWGAFSVCIQTELANGQTSSLDTGPTVTFRVPRPVLFPTSGQLFYAAQGQAVIGSATLVAGSATVNCPYVTADNPIFLTNGTGWCRVSARVAGTSFTIASSSGADVSVIHYVVLTPA